MGVWRSLGPATAGESHAPSLLFPPPVTTAPPSPVPQVAACCASSAPMYAGSAVFLQSHDCRTARRTCAVRGAGVGHRQCDYARRGRCAVHLCPPTRSLNLLWQHYMCLISRTGSKKAKGGKMIVKKAVPGEWGIGSTADAMLQITKLPLLVVQPDAVRSLGRANLRSQHAPDEQVRCCHVSCTSCTLPLMIYNAVTCIVQQPCRSLRSFSLLCSPWRRSS